MFCSKLDGYTEDSGGSICAKIGLKSSLVISNVFMCVVICCTDSSYNFKWKFSRGVRCTIFFKYCTWVIRHSDVVGDPKTRNPRGTSPKVWSPNPTRPRKADPEPTPTSADPKFYLKNPRNPENPRGTSPKCWSPNPTQPRLLLPKYITNSEKVYL